MRNFAFFCLLSAVLTMAEPLTLSNAIAKARANNPKIQKERTSLDAAESERTEARSRFLPELSISGRVTKINDPITIDLNPIRQAMIGIHAAEAENPYSAYYLGAYKGAYELAYKQALGAGADEATAAATADAAATKYASENAKQVGYTTLDEKLPSFETKVQDDLFFNLRATVVWPIFTGGKIWSAYKAAAENKDAKQAEFDMAENNVLVEVCERYFMLRLAEEMLKLREESLANMEAHLKRAKELEEGGQMSYAERLRAEVAYYEAETERDNADRSVSLARLALANSIHGDTALTAVTPIGVPESFDNLETWKERAVKNHPALRQLRVQKKRSERAVTAARGDYFPTFALFGYKELYTKDLTILEPEWAVGLQMNWVLFKGGETASKVSKAKSTERSLTYMEAQITEDIGLLVEKQYRELDYARAKLQSLAKTKELATESLRSQTQAYEAGLATSLDIVDAEFSLSRLRIAELKANYDALMAWIGLLNAAGEISKVGEMVK